MSFQRELIVEGTVESLAAARPGWWP